MRLNTDNFTLQFYTITSVNIYGFTETYRTDLNFLRNMNKIKEIFIISRKSLYQFLYHTAYSIF